MDSRFNAAKMNEMRNAFSLFDRDGDGSISAKVPEYREKCLEIEIILQELGSVMKTMGMAPSEDTVEVTYQGPVLKLDVSPRQRMIKAADSDGSGVIEFQEFMDMICDQMEVTEEEIEEAFKMFDRDNSGSINHNEVK